MSTVYRAVDQRTQQPVACKVMNAASSQDPKVRARFAGTVCVVDHPNVVPVYELGESGGTLFVIMQLVVGKDMQTLVEEGPQKPERALSIFRQLCSALTTLHSRGMLHLDVKPSNVLLTQAPGLIPGSTPADPEPADSTVPPDHVYLADYGLLAPDSVERRPTFVGTPSYASPEHLRGRAIGPAADVYSLTCLLFALLSGRPPYRGDLATVIGGHLRGRVPSLAGLTGLPRAVDAVVQAGLHEDPLSRPGTPDELSSAAHHALLRT